MKDYAVFGGRFRSAIAFPELPEQEDDGPVDWSLEVVPCVPDMKDALQLGEHRINKDVGAHLYRHDGGFRLAYDDTGTFEVARDGRSILWAPAPGASEDAARLDVIGFVLALALHAAGVYTLHGSAVATQNGVAAFIAPKGHGKSTLAMSLVAAGAHLVTDDSLAVSAGSGAVHAAPGIQSVRLWPDSFERMPEGSVREVASLDGKRLLRVERDRGLARSAPLQAIYLLTPVRSDPAAPAVRRTKIEPGMSALVLVGHAKLAGLLQGTPEAAVLLSHAAAVAREVPVYALETARDLNRLPEVVEELLKWHPAGPA